MNAGYGSKSFCCQMIPTIVVLDDNPNKKIVSQIRSIALSLLIIGS